MTSGWLHHRKVIPALSDKAKQSSYPPQGQMDCKVEAHVDAEHSFFLLSTRMTALFAQGRVAFGNFGFCPCQTNRTF